MKRYSVLTIILLLTLAPTVCLASDVDGVAKDTGKAAELFQQTEQAAMYTPLDMNFSSFVNRLAREMPLSVKKLHQLGLSI